MDEELKKTLDLINKRLEKIEKYLANHPTFSPYKSYDKSERDPLFEDAVKVVCHYGRASSSLIQRRLQIGFNKAARIIEQLEEAGVVGPANGLDPREVLVKDADKLISNLK